MALFGLPSSKASLPRSPVHDVTFTAGKEALYDAIFMYRQRSFPPTVFDHLLLRHGMDVLLSSGKASMVYECQVYGYMV